MDYKRGMYTNCTDDPYRIEILSATPPFIPFNNNLPPPALIQQLKTKHEKTGSGYIFKNIRGKIDHQSNIDLIFDNTVNGIFNYYHPYEGTLGAKANTIYEVVKQDNKWIAIKKNCRKGGKHKRQRMSRRKSRKSKQTRRK